MDRYEIASGKGDQPIAYKFKEAESSDTVVKYMQKCIKDDVMLDASTLRSSVIEDAAVKMCKSLGVALVVATDKEGDLLPLVYGYKKIYTAEKLPDTCRSAICGEGVNPADVDPSVEILLAIINKSIDRDK